MPTSAKKHNDDKDLLKGLKRAQRSGTVEELRSRPKGDDEETVIEKLDNLPEGYGKPKTAKANPRATTVFKARISERTHKEMMAHREENIGVTYAGMIEEMWKLFKEKNGIS